MRRVAAMSKPRLSIDEQINHMKSKGIAFNITPESDAKKFLSESNYYFKIKSYAKNYEKYVSVNSIEQYVNLEFAYLQELSILDAYLRKILFEMIIDIEHFAKVQLLNDFAGNSDENGYDIVAKFMALPQNSYIEDNIIKRKSPNSYCSELIEKYKDNLAIWNIVEMLSFSDFLRLYKFYYENYAGNGSRYYQCLWAVKFLRNAVAHNNCLLNSLVKPYKRSLKPTKNLKSFFANKTEITYSNRHWENPFIHDFMATIHLTNKIVSSAKVRKAHMSELKDFFEDRCLRNKDYFRNNEKIKSSYKFVKLAIDYYNTY